MTEKSPGTLPVTSPETPSGKIPDVTLSTAIRIDGKSVTGIDLRKPRTGELRGLKMTDVIQMDTDTMITLLARITRPPLSPDQVAALDPADFMALCSRVLHFFVPKSEIAAMGPGL